MSKTPEDLGDKLIALPHRKRAELAAMLIASLDPGVDEDVTELWLDEAERRLAAYDAGLTSARDADEVFAEIRAGLK